MEYGKEIKQFEFDGSHSGQDVILINGCFIIYEKGLLIKGLPPLNHIYTKWRDMSGVILYEGETTKVIIELENKAGEIVAENKNKPEDVIAFYDLITVQKEKYRYYDSLRELKVDLEEVSIVMDSDRWENKACLDTVTGEIIYIPAELDEDEEDRYIAIPERTSNDGYDMMVQFTKRLEDFNISQILFDALDGRGAFRRFKNVLRRYPRIEEQWYKYGYNSSIWLNYEF